jgi:hypothetical protein
MNFFIESIDDEVTRCYYTNQNAGIQNSLGEFNHYSESNAPVHVVKITSETDLMINMVSWDITISSIKNVTTDKAFNMGCYFTNGEDFQPYIVDFSTGGQQHEKLLYRHIKITPFIDVTEDNRKTDTISGVIRRLYDFNGIDNQLPAGSWYFIFTGIVYDVLQEDMIVHTKTWINMSNNPEDIEIVSYDAGMVDGYWMGEFDSNIALNYWGVKSILLNGKLMVHANNSFMFWWDNWINANGYWKVKWNKPVKTTTFRMIVNNGTQIFNPLKAYECICGIGGPGNYDLVTHYLDNQPNPVQNMPVAASPYLLTLDVPLI